MDNYEILNKDYWDEILSDLERKAENLDRKYRRYNNSLEAMGENTVIKERNIYYFAVDDYKASEDLQSILDTIENDNLLKALKKLKPIELQIIIYRFQYEMKIKDISKVLNKCESTVSERLGKILDKLILSMNLSIKKK
ncbi:MAG: hypothetical protein N2645_15455 [Clostridia bacterium]|nr:hypothetical protein [Clostridia bacterium]